MTLQKLTFTKHLEVIVVIGCLNTDHITAIKTPESKRKPGCRALGLIQRIDTILFLEYFVLCEFFFFNKYFYSLGISWNEF